MRECIHCGACCRGYSIELQEHDVIREPALLQYGTRWEELPEHRKESFHRSPWVIETYSQTCPFLTVDWTCRIYNTRPGVCRRFQPTRLNCHMSKLEERGLDIKGFMENGLLIYNADPMITAGVIFSIDPESIEPIGIRRGINPTRKPLDELIDIAYFERFKEKMLRS